MKIDFEQKLVALGGKPIVDDAGKAMTLGDVAVNALMGVYPGEQIDGKEKLRRFQVAERIYGAGPVEIDEAKDIELIERLIGHAYGPIIVGPAHKALHASS